jgi:hypothetical protein
VKCPALARPRKICIFQGLIGQAEGRVEKANPVILREPRQRRDDRRISLIHMEILRFAPHQMVQDLAQDDKSISFKFFNSP